METTLESTQEICPACGALGLREAHSGFCKRCTIELGLCLNCGGFSQPGHKVCKRCTFLLWLTENANQIEHLMAVCGVSPYRAIMMLREDYKGIFTCSSCGEATQSPSHGISIGFCVKNRRCRTAHTKMRHLLYVKHVSHDAALKQVLGEME